MNILSPIHVYIQNHYQSNLNCYTINNKNNEKYLFWKKYPKTNKYTT